MADISTDELAHLDALAQTLRRRLRVLEMQCATYGSLAVPPHLVLEREDAERQLRHVVTELRRLRPRPSDTGCPYVGLLTFEETDSAFFYGREILVAELIEKLRHRNFLAVLGPSGSGKSSVVRAGLIPTLKGGGLPGSEYWHYVALKPGARPLDALAVAVTKLQGGNLGASAQMRTVLEQNDRALLLAADMLQSDQKAARLVLVIDQCEELWTLASTELEARPASTDQEQYRFIQLLVTTMTVPESPVLIILTMRADFLHRVAEHPALAHAVGEHVAIVSPMTPAELRNAIVRPAEMLGGSFESGLVDELIEQVQNQPGALPLLEYTLLELWKDRRPDGTMTWESFKTLGGVEGGLAHRADQILLEHYTLLQREELRNVLLRLVQPGKGVADTRRRVRLDDLVPADGSQATLQALLKPLADERLITTGRDPTSGAETVEISHEALIQVWPTFGQWLQQAREDLRFHLQLSEAATEWQAHDQSGDFLWNGLRLAMAEAWIARTQPRLNARDQAFLQTSRAQQQARIAAEEAARQRELIQAQALVAEQQRRIEEQAHAAKRLRQLRVRLLVGLFMVFTMICVAAAYGVYSYTVDQANRQLKGLFGEVVQAAAAGVDGDQFEALARDSKPRTDGYTDDLRYWQHVMWLHTVGRLLNDASVYTYIRGNAPNEVIFIGSSAAMREPRSGAKFREPYVLDSAQSVLLSGLEETATSSQVYVDEQGWWLSAYTPIKNSRGAIVGGLGMDFRSDEVGQVQREMARNILLAFAFAYTVLFVLIGLIAKLFTDQIGVLTRNIEHSSEEMKRTRDIKGQQSDNLTAGELD